MSTPTPRTAAVWLSEWKAHENSGGRSSPAHGMCDFAEQLERELDAERNKYGSLALAYGCMDTEVRSLREELAALKAELAEAKAVLQNPAKWHQWCDIRVLEQLEAAQKELAARERQLVICEAVVDQHADTILKLSEELARARDDEALLIEYHDLWLICHESNPRAPVTGEMTRLGRLRGEVFAAIELRISGRAK